jgi:cysteinyl-tRNA synthetase, unknown class
MKKIIVLQLLLVFLFACSKDGDDQDYKQLMRDFVIGISQYAKASKPGFLIIPQNGIEIITVDGESGSDLHTSYLNAIDGHGQEDLFYGYTADNKATPASDNSYLREFLDKSKGQGKVILVTDYCSTASYVNDSYSKNKAANYISFAASHRELDNIPAYPIPIYAENNSAVTTFAGVKNFLYLLNTANYSSKAAFINAVAATNYDLLIMDLYFDETTLFTSSDITQLKNKANGGKRLVVSYMSIGEAEDYRDYWQAGWNSSPPAFVDSENPDWPGNYKVKYWDPSWQSIIYGNDNSYLKKILNAGFDGVYLDIIEAFEYFEQ